MEVPDSGPPEALTIKHEVPEMDPHDDCVSLHKGSPSRPCIFLPICVVIGDGQCWVLDPVTDVPLQIRLGEGTSSGGAQAGLIPKPSARRQL